MRLICLNATRNTWVRQLLLLIPNHWVTTDLHVLTWRWSYNNNHRSDWHENWISAEVELIVAPLKTPNDKQHRRRMQDKKPPLLPSIFFVILPIFPIYPKIFLLQPSINFHWSAIAIWWNIPVLLCTYVACYQTRMSKRGTRMWHSGRIISFIATNQCMTEYVELTGMAKKNWESTSLFDTSIPTVKNNPRVMVLYCANFALKIDK